jgi:hypothetical protein
MKLPTPALPCWAIFEGPCGIKHCPIVVTPGLVLATDY